MKTNKKLTHGIILMIATLVLICGTVFTASDATEVSEAQNVAAQNGKAGIVASLEQTENRMLDAAQLAGVTVTKTETEIVTVASKSEAEAATAEKQAEGEAAQAGETA